MTMAYIKIYNPKTHKLRCYTQFKTNGYVNLSSIWFYNSPDKIHVYNTFVDGIKIRANRKRISNYETTICLYDVSIDGMTIPYFEEYYIRWNQLLNIRHFVKTKVKAFTAIKHPDPEVHQTLRALLHYDSKKVKSFLTD